MMKLRVGLGIDAHRLVEGRPLILGGVHIPSVRGLSGHSDGDVVLHSVADALLGALAGPDIGTLFPSSDERWKGAPSRIFVEGALQWVTERGYHPVQLDTVIVAEAPRLSPHLDEMRERLADILGLSKTSIGMKATTLDGMGFTGRGEGIMAQAIATVEQT